jgi:ABC-2 type transport system ATP-binding protein
VRPAIAVSNLSKAYRSGKQALDAINLEIQPNEVFCLLGPNGAGKTSLVRILATQLLPTAGQVQILGHDAVQQPHLVRESMAIVPQEGRPGQDLNAWDYVYWYLQVRGLPRREAATRTESTLKEMGLWEVRRTLAGHLSGGLRRRILIAMAVATRPKILFLDEPTVGLDPEARVQTWELIAQLRQQSTVILTTHLMDEAEALSDRIGILVDGRLVETGTPRELGRRVRGGAKIVLANGLDPAWLRQRGEVVVRGRQLVVYPWHEAASQEVTAAALASQIEFSVQPISLEDAYFQAVKQREGVAL